MLPYLMITMVRNVILIISKKQGDIYGNNNIMIILLARFDERDALRTNSTGRERTGKGNKNIYPPKTH